MTLIQILIQFFTIIANQEVQLSDQGSPWFQSLFITKGLLGKNSEESDSLLVRIIIV